MFCINCGSKLTDGAKFCANCGARVTQTTGQLKSLSFSECDFNDLTPLEALTKLTSLRLVFIPAEDLSPLWGMTSLETLQLTHCAAGDLTPIAGITMLKELYISGCPVSDLSALENLTELTRLTIEETTAGDLTPLRNLAKLTRLELSGPDGAEGRNISDLSALRGLTELEYLSIVNGGISDLSPLEGLTRLTFLSLHSNAVADISPLETLAGLTQLDLSYNEISDISPFQRRYSFRYQKSIQHKKIHSISPADILYYFAQELHIRRILPALHQPPQLVAEALPSGYISPQKIEQIWVLEHLVHQIRVCRRQYLWKVVDSLSGALHQMPLYVHIEYALAPPVFQRFHGIPSAARFVIQLIHQGNIGPPWNLCNDPLHNFYAGPALCELSHILDIFG